MAKCYFCEEETHECEMSVYRLKPTDDKPVGLLCADCANGNVTVNGFLVGYSEGKYKVWHPIFDGAFDIFTAETEVEAVNWCKTQDFDVWTERLL
jgi:hypothetical protein